MADLKALLISKVTLDIAPAAIMQRLKKSAAENALIRAGADPADLGGYAIRDAIDAGTSEMDMAMDDRDAMELEIANRFPDAEYRDTWVCFLSRIYKCGTHYPVTLRRLGGIYILSLNTLPIDSKYYTVPERTLFVGGFDLASLAIW